MAAIKGIAEFFGTRMAWVPNPGALVNVGMIRISEEGLAGFRGDHPP